MPDHSATADPTPRYEEFVRLFVAHEGRLRAFIRALLPTWADVDEVMQETSLVAWRKFARFERGTNFMAWAATIARFEALDRCLAKLGDTQRELLLLSYQPGARLHEVAARAGRSVQGHYKSVQRLRARLLECIEGELKREIA